MKRKKNVAKKSETQNKFKHLHTMCVSVQSTKHKFSISHSNHLK